MHRFTTVRVPTEHGFPREVPLTALEWVEGIYIGVKSTQTIRIRLLDGEVVDAVSAADRGPLIRRVEFGVLPGEHIRISALEVQVYGPGPL